MQISIQELQLVNALIQVDGEGKAKQYPLAELKVALEVFDALKTCTKDENDNKVFIDGEIEFTTEQKAMILKSMEGRNFAVLDAESLFALQKKLK